MLAWFSPSAWALSPGPHPVLCNAMLPFSFTMTIGSSVSAGALMRRIRGRELLLPACLLPRLLLLYSLHWIQTWGDDGRKSEREKEREQGNGKMTAEERTEKSLHSQTKQSLSNCWLGLRFSSTPPPHTHAYRVCVCLWTLPWLFWNNQVAAAVCDKCRFHSRNLSQSETPP